MNGQYFHRVNQLSPTRLWINNPTLKETDLAIAAGAISCKTNPTHSMKMIQKEDDNYVLSIIDEVLKETKEDNEAADFIQQRLVKSVLNKFLPLYERNPGKNGFVTIQGNPLADDDPVNIVNEALRYRRL